MIRSPDGHCRVFDSKAKGTIAGNGAGVIALKLLEDALRDRDYIHALIKGTAINNDGRQKIGYTSPSIEGQADVIRTCLRVAEVDPESITYIEAHGTGTVLGDPAEIEALKLAFNSKKRQFCAVGALKSNIGHLDAAAGIAGIIKTTLSLSHRLIPPSLHFENPNPKIDFEKSPFYVNKRLTPWNANGKPLRAGVSSFGIGGTNSHVVLEEWKKTEGNRIPGRAVQLIPLSAKTQTARDTMTRNLSEFLKENTSVNLMDVAYTLQTGRPVLPHRSIMVARDINQVVREFNTPDSPTVQSFSGSQVSRPVVFMFSGQGSQYINMGLGLYKAEPVFRNQLDRCFAILKNITGEDFNKILYPPNGADGSALNQTRVTQPLLFSIEYALARLLIEWGILPYAMIGHSIGEYVAACLARVFSLEDALKLVVARGKIMHQVPRGSMLAVTMSEEELTPLLDSTLSLAAVNSSSHCVVSGPDDAVERFENTLAEMDCRTTRLHTSHAFHSQMMDPVLPEFEAIVRQVTLNPPEKPFVSNATGDWINPQDCIDPKYWTRHIRGTVSFAPGLELLFDRENTVFIEVGPGKSLSTFVRQHDGKKDHHVVLNLLRHPKENLDDSQLLLEKIGRLWLYGTSIDWQAFHKEESPYRIPLPTYPFERYRFWIEGDLFTSNTPPAITGSTVKKNKNIADWFYVPSWSRSQEFVFNNTMPDDGENHRWLLFLDDTGLGKQLVQQLEDLSQPVISVSVGKRFVKTDPTHYTLDPHQSKDYITLFGELAKDDLVPTVIVHMWSMFTSLIPTPAPSPGNNSHTLNSESALESIDIFERRQYYGFYSIIFQVQAIGHLNIHDDMKIIVLTRNTQEVTGEEELCADHATILGTVKVIPQEYPNIICRNIDIQCPPTGLESHRLPRVARQLINDSLLTVSDPIAAYRGSHRWVQNYKPVSPDPDISHSPLREKGVYLLTGGLGNIAMEIAKYLAESVQARLILTGRSSFPAREEWDHWLSAHPSDHPVSTKIKKLLYFESVGAEVMAVSADVSVPEDMEQVIDRAINQWGAINGVIHAAGLTDEASLQTIADIIPDDGRIQFQPKVYGLLVLEHLLRDKKLDFYLLMSSIASVLGGLGFASYAAANIFMDTIALNNKRSGQAPWISLNWDGWNFEPQAVSSPDEPVILPNEGILTLKQILSQINASQLVISTADLQTRIDRWINPGSSTDEENEQQTAPNLMQRPDWNQDYVAPRNPLEKQIADIWQKFFGINAIGIHDDFFELGGDSLKVMTITSRIHKALDVVIPLGEFFNYPTIASLSTYIYNSRESKYSGIQPVEKKEYYPLSPAQNRLYILHRIEPGHISYNVSIIISLSGNLNIPTLEETFKKLISRHESLRTTFEMVGDVPVQRIRNPHDIKLEVPRYETDSRDGIEPIVFNFVRPFDLSRVPLLRVGIIRVEEKQHILMVDMHHILTDGISELLLTRDFIEFYAGGNPAPLVIQYKDYTEWQHSPHVVETIKIQEEYWVKELEGEITTLNLPIDFPRPPVQNFEGDFIGFELSEEQTKALNELALSQGITLFMALLAIFNVFLAKISNQENIMVGIPVSSRNHADLAQVIGMFVNTLVIRNVTHGGHKFTDFLKKVKNRALKAFENQDYPFEELVEKFEMERDMSRNPLFDVMFVMRGVSETPEGSAGRKVDGLDIVPYAYENKTSQFDLTLIGLEKSQTLELSFEYCVKLFHQNTILKFIEYFKKIISSVILNPETDIADIEIISSEGKKEILHTFNDTRADYPADQAVHQLFRQQANRLSDHTAVVFENRQLTWRGLDEYTDRLALQLEEKGVRANAIVGLMMERSLEMMIGILGILKAGAAYMPVDPNYPEERIRFMLVDSDTKVLVTAEEIMNLKSLDVKGYIENIFIKSRQFTNLSVSQLRTLPDSSFSGLAYVIYTSGSTGEPKGVLIEHSPLVNRLNWMQKKFMLNRGDLVIQKTPFTFDVSVWELLWWSTAGAKLCFLIPDGEKEPDRIFTTIKKHKVTVMHFVPSMLAVFLEYLETSDEEINLALLRQVITSGEALTLSQVTLFHRLLNKENSICLSNLYGPTEATIDVSFFDCPPGLPLDRVPIGRPIDNIKLYIVDKSFYLQPIGIPGELCISGDGLARGYLNRPELTAEKFDRDFRNYRDYRDLRKDKGQTNLQDDPPALPPDTYACLYKTGDLARWLPGGDIEFLGRLDHQVKIRGFRIELGEIEARLTRHPNLKEAIVTVRERADAGSAGTFLCAYFTADRELTTPHLKEFLLQAIPAYMIPSYFIQLEKIPVTPNGKADKKALHAMQIEADTGVKYVEPGNPVETLILGIWKEILNVDKIGVNDNFFDAGGNSLNIIKINSKLKKSLERDIPVVSMFRYPTARSLAQYLDNQNGGTGEPIISDEKIDQSIDVMEEATNFFLN